MSLYRFAWVIEGELAAMAMPDGYAGDWDELKSRGVRALVNLTMRGRYMDDPEARGLVSRGQTYGMDLDGVALIGTGRRDNRTLERSVRRHQAQSEIPRRQSFRSK